jgi:hypothetical protein
MARIEKFFGGLDYINLTASVGKGGVNLKDDVMVVQAMLKYAFQGHPFFKKFKFPKPTGTIDDATKALIERYQKYLRRKENVEVPVDGVIDRAVGERPFGRRGIWAILCLNGDLVKVRLLKGGESNEIFDLCREYPQLHAVFDDVPVGSLNLSLEPSARRLGSLNLSLE